MNPLVFPLALVSGFGLAGILFGWLLLNRAGTLMTAADRRARAEREPYEAALRDMREMADCVSAEVRQLQQQSLPTPGPHKPGLNLNKRSQALRMHRRGESSEQIATALQIPVQEVELLLKVHRIVLSNL